MTVISVLHNISTMSIRHMWLGAFLLSIAAVWSGAIVAMVMWRTGGGYLPYLFVVAIAAAFALHTYRIWKASSENDDARG